MQLPPMEPMHFLDKFLRGLKPKTRMEFELKYPQTLIEAIRLADSFDSIIYRKIIPLAPSTPSHSHSRPAANILSDGKVYQTSIRAGNLRKIRKHIYINPIIFINTI